MDPGREKARWDSKLETSQKQARRRSTAGIYAIRRGHENDRLRVEKVDLCGAKVEQEVVVTRSLVGSRWAQGGTE